MLVGVMSALASDYAYIVQRHIAELQKLSTRCLHLLERLQSIASATRHTALFVFSAWAISYTDRLYALFSNKKKEQ